MSRRRVRGLSEGLGIAGFLQTGVYGTGNAFGEFGDHQASGKKAHCPTPPYLSPPRIDPTIPPICVWVVIWIEAVIHESSPLSLKTLSFGSSCTSSTGIVVPRIRVCMIKLPKCRQCTGSQAWASVKKASITLNSLLFLHLG